MSKIVCFGEVLFDVFPDGMEIGGAPLNVANRLASFNNDVSIISAVGNDKLGKAIIEFLNKANVDTNQIQIKEDLPTGTVKVALNSSGSASYEIVNPVAWDSITETKSQHVKVNEADAFIFGSLVCRNETSKHSLFQLLKSTKFAVFDVNLRAPYYKVEDLKILMNHSDFIKFNDDEIFEIAADLGSKFKGLEQNIEYVAKTTQTNNICVTKGRHGAVLHLDGKQYYNSGYITKVADTVGAGDSFLATLINHFLANTPPQYAIDEACAVGALVASKKGANPEISLGEITQFKKGF